MRKRKPQKAASEMARQAAKLNATPRWITKEDFKEMEAVYIAARKTTLLAGFNCHVDHIVPLKGKEVCGLHVPWNLRVVSQSYNSQKNNNLDEGVFFGPSQNGGVLIHKSALPWNWRK
jgi:5-methylcytosine-specific restriction endonuclease McrA